MSLLIYLSVVYSLLYPEFQVNAQFPKNNVKIGIQYKNYYCGRLELCETLTTTPSPNWILDTYCGIDELTEKMILFMNRCHIFKANCDGLGFFKTASSYDCNEALKGKTILSYDAQEGTIQEVNLGQDQDNEAAEETQYND